MAEDKKPPKEYDVGRGKPPKEHQFKPGQSGNLNGRPKGSHNFVTTLEKELAKMVTVNEGGQRMRVTKRQAAVMQLISKALSGEARAMHLLFNVLRYAEGGAEPGVPELLGEADQLVLKDIQARVLEFGKEDDDEIGDK